MRPTIHPPLDGDPDLLALPDPWPVPGRAVAAGRLAVPPSKSVTHRLFNLALLAGLPAVVERPLVAEDTRLFLGALRGLGWRVDERPEEVELAPPQRAPSKAALFCGNAGTLYRFLVATLTVVPGEWTLDGVPRLRERPVGPLVEALRRLGADIQELGRPGYPPLRIRGGALRGGRVQLDAGESSQYLSAILMAGVRAAAAVEIEVPALVSAPYVALTLDAMAAFGGRVEAAAGRYRVEPSVLAGGHHRVEGDYSAAAYPAAAAALTGGRVVLAELAGGSRQGDRRFLEVLSAMGARVAWGAGGVEVAGTGELEGLDLDFSDMPDQVPTLASVAPFARGTTRVRGVAHLRIKESDRLAAMASELARVGAQVEELPDGLVIPGVWAATPPPEDPVVVQTHGDHRIAMSLAVTGLRRPGVSIARPPVVAKSYPGFFRDFTTLVSRPAAGR